MFPALPENLPRRLQDLPPKGARLCLRVARFVETDLRLALSGRPVLVGFSGGADSTALLLILFYLAPRLGLSLRAAHLDHGLRPSSAEESRACAALCAALNVPCLVSRVEADLLKREKTGLEEAARRARYAFYARTLRHAHELLALGHQNNDLAEDMLMRLIRGAGWPSLAGMPARDDQRQLIRPVLLIPRSELEDFLNSLEVSWTRDPSNSDPAYLRNRVRATLLPLFLRENPAFLRTAATLWRLARVDEDFFQTLLASPRAHSGPVSPVRPSPSGADPGENSEEAPGTGLQTPAAVLASLPQALRLRL
ncbi:MAG: tRNA lysidine(34) synthetase TilS, partial [Deltaproteobacteria bacterium]|nr:tRNA lysidine(34) synthetase TilS [Deltaproteobacteria bacterium]